MHKGKTYENINTTDKVNKNISYFGVVVCCLQDDITKFFPKRFATYRIRYV